MLIPEVVMKIENSCELSTDAKYEINLGKSAFSSVDAGILYILGLAMILLVKSSSM